MVKAKKRKAKPFYRIIQLPPDAKGKPQEKLKFHYHPGQRRARRSKKRFILVLAGTQGGKTCFGPVWLLREIEKRGPGDYMVVTPTYPLLVKKALPEFMRLFKRQLQLGEYKTQNKVFEFSDSAAKRMFGDRYDADIPTQIFFGHASDPESLESATAKAVWMDEAGQKTFKLESWEAIQRRLSIHQGRALITTTPYSLGWLKQLLFDPWDAAKRNHPTIDVIQFDSTKNPAFPPAEFERARNTLPPWKFALFYKAVFSRPAGQVYSNYDEMCHRCPRFSIPEAWPRYLGLDFGSVNTASVFFAEEQLNGRPTGKLYAYREYKAAERSAAEHIHELLKGEPRIPTCAGGSKSEGQWRREFQQGGTVKDARGNSIRVPGLPIHGPAKSETQSIQVGIQRVFSAFGLNKIVIFDDLIGLLDEVNSYSYALNEMGDPTEDIEDKEHYHRLDAVRYILSYLNVDRPKPTYTSPVARPGLQNL